MSISIKMQGDRGVWRRLLCFAASLGLHGLIAAAMLILPPFPESFRAAQARIQKDEPAEPKKLRVIYWLKRNERLPNITPAQANDEAASRSPKKGALYVRARPAPEKARDQFTFVPEPTVKVQPTLPSANFVMMESRAAPVPQKPTLKFSLPAAERPQASPQLIVEPNLNPTPQQSLPRMMTESLPAAKAPPKKFVSPKAAPRPLRERVIDAPEGLPLTQATVALPRLPVAVGEVGAVKAPPRVEAAPQASATAGSGASGGGQGGIKVDTTAVVISANPKSDRLVLPEGNRRAEIAVGGVAGGGRGTGGSPDGIVVPGLSVRNGGNASAAAGPAKGAPAPEIVAGPEATPTGPPAPRRRIATTTISVPQWPNTRRVPGPVEDEFRGRPVYSTVVPGPPSFPDWVIWFGESQQSPPGTRIMMRPPVVEMASMLTLAPGSTTAAKCWLRARLGKDGKLSIVQVSQGLGGEQAAELKNSLAKWLWAPAVRNGEAVDVDVVIEAELKR